MVDSSVSGQDYTKTYTLDLVGNRMKLVTSKEGLPTETTISTYNSRDQLLTETTGSTTINYGYDDNGSLITQNGNGSSRTQAWDLRGRLQSAVVDGVTTSYAYTSDGIRSRVSVDGVTTDYIVDSMTPSGYVQVVEELASGVLAVRYTYGASLDPISETRNGSTSVYLADGHSGVRQAINLAGAVLMAQRFDAYGVSVAKVGTLNTPIGYRGERFDSTLGQYYLRARYYDPRQGRFTGMDPFHGNYGDTSQAMRYGYAGANPIWGMDPSGLFSVGQISMATGIVGGVIGAGIGAYSGYRQSGTLFSWTTLGYAALGFFVGFGVGFTIGYTAATLGLGSAGAFAVRGPGIYLTRVLDKIVPQASRIFQGVSSQSKSGYYLVVDSLALGLASGAIVRSVGGQFVPDGSIKYLDISALTAYGATNGLPTVVVAGLQALGFGTSGIIQVPGWLSLAAVYMLGFNIGYWGVESIIQIKNKII
jgi:RHS repeat-associated protein